MTYRRVANFKTASEFRAYLDAGGIELDFDDEMTSAATNPLGDSYDLDGFAIGNRFCILPMEGWDGTTDGKPSELTTRRWERFGISGAKLIWGGEAVAVRNEGRANPNQLVIDDRNLASLEGLRESLVRAHVRQFGTDDGLLVGLQLTHSGRFARPNEKSRLEPRILYHHPILDRKFGGADESAILSDTEILRLIDDFVAAAALARKAGFAFVDIKHCHGYLGHEFLSSFDRTGSFGGSFENRTRFLRDVVAGIRSQGQDLGIAVRFSATDWLPFRRGETGVGEPEPFEGDRYPYAFGGDGSGLGEDLSEPTAFLDLLDALGIRLACISVGSPYYNPHYQRPAIFPPSDGYSPPEDPLVGVARQLSVTARLKRRRPHLAIVGSGYSYLQEWLPHVAQRQVRTGAVDFVGLGRMVLSYPDLPADVLSGRPLKRKQLCRTFSDCTTAPRNGLVSGCYPLDEAYKRLPEAKRLAAIKRS